MMMIGYALDHPSGMYHMYNPTTDSVVISNSVKWKDFNRWKVSSSDKPTTNLYGPSQTDHSTAIEDPITSNHEPDNLVTFLDQAPPSLPSDDDDSISLESLPGHSLQLPTPPPLIHTRSQGPVVSPTETSTNPAVQRVLRQLQTSSSYKVIGDTTPRRTFHSDDSDAPIINHIFTDELCIAYSSVGRTIHAIC